MRPVSPDDVGVIVDGLDTAWRHRTVGAVPIGAAGLKARLAHVRVTNEQLSVLSSAFLEERRAQAKGILGEGAYADEEVQFFLLPVPGSIAALYRWQNGYAIVLSLGLIEILRLSSVAGQLHSALERLRHSAAVKSALGAQTFARTVTLLTRMTAYINASAALSHLEARPVPDVLGGLDTATRHRAEVVLEAAIMFVLLHELGHVKFQRKGHCSGCLSADVQWEFAVPEALDVHKEEELFADRFALDAVPPGFRLALSHAACLLLQLHTYVDTLRDDGERQHPLAVNRLMAMQHHAGAGASLDTGHQALQVAISLGARLWAKGGQKASSIGRLEALRRFVESEKNFDWRPLREALVALSCGDRTGHVRT